MASKLLTSSMSGLLTPAAARDAATALVAEVDQTPAQD
jgi:hypothetical protein